jgi:hypothetical protein
VLPTVMILRPRLFSRLRLFSQRQALSHQWLFSHLLLLLYLLALSHQQQFSHLQQTVLTRGPQQLLVRQSLASAPMLLAPTGADG